MLTPCVWPIIPMTVSFFLKRAKDDKKKGIRDAVTYGISIIVIYMGLAAVITALFGPQKLNELATNAPFNIFFFLMLVVFALSFFGWFELRLPASWGNAIDNKSSSNNRLAFHLPDGIHTFFGVILLYSTSSRTSSCTSSNKWRLGSTSNRYVWFCICISLAFHTVCIVPNMAEAST